MTTKTFGFSFGRNCKPQFQQSFGFGRNYTVTFGASFGFGETENSSFGLTLDNSILKYIDDLPWQIK